MTEKKMGAMSPQREWIRLRVNIAMGRIAGNIRWKDWLKKSQMPVKKDLTNDCPFDIL